MKSNQPQAIASTTGARTLASRPRLMLFSNSSYHSIQWKSVRGAFPMVFCRHAFPIRGKGSEDSVG